MNKKTIIYIVLACVIIIGIVAIFMVQDIEKPVNNVTNTTNSTGVSLRNQIMGATQNYVANTNTITTNNTNVDDLEKYNKETDDSYETFKDAEGVSFMYPKGWVSLGTDETPAYMSPDGKGATVNISKDAMSEETTVVTDFDAYMGFQKIYLMQQMTLLSDIQEKQVNLNGKKAYILNYVAESEENSITLQLNVTQVAFVDEDNKIYILTLAVFDKYYEEMKTVFDKMIRSFMVEK